MSETDDEKFIAWAQKKVGIYLTDTDEARLFALARRGAEKDAVVVFLGQVQRLSDELSRLRVENIQMQAALGYAICVEDERHIIPENPFKCGICDARNRAVKDTLPPPPSGR